MLANMAMPPRILIADDNAMVRIALRQLLDGPDEVEFVEAENGRDAVSKVLELRPEIAILDLAMPVMDGISAARQINKACPQTSIFLCTMHWSPLLETEAQKAGVRQVASKAHVTVLVTAVKQLLREYAASTSEVNGSSTTKPALQGAPEGPVDMAASAADEPGATAKPSEPQGPTRMRRLG